MVCARGALVGHEMTREWRFICTTRSATRYWPSQWRKSIDVYLMPSPPQPSVILVELEPLPLGASFPVFYMEWYCPGCCICCFSLWLTLRRDLESGRPGKVSTQVCEDRPSAEFCSPSFVIFLPCAKQKRDAERFGRCDFAY